MKKFYLLSMTLLLLASCSGLQIDDTAHNQVLAYTAGKAMGLGVNKLVPAADPQLAAAWEGLMARSAGMDRVPPVEIVKLYNDIVIIAGNHIDDPYGVTADLGVLLLIYGARFDDEGRLSAIDPVPISILQYFEMGYRNGRQVALR